MAYGVRFKVPFASRDGNAYQLWIEQENYAGAISTIRGRESPAVIEWGRRGIDVFTPLRASSTAISIWRSTGAELDDLLNSYVHEFQVRIVWGATQGDITAGSYTLYWLGYLILDNYEDSLTEIPDGLDLEANDGLAELKDIPYTDASGDPELAYTGREAIRVIAKRCLDKIGYALAYRTASRLYPDGVTPNVDPWAKLEVDNAVFYDEKGDAMSCYEVLQQLCYRMASILYQRDGEWHFVAVELLESGAAYTVYKYTSAGAANGTTTQGTPIDVDALLVAETALRENGRRGFLEPISIARLQFDHGLIPSLIRAGGFEGTYVRGGRGNVAVGDAAADYWTLSTAGAYDPVIRDSNGATYAAPATGPKGKGTGRSGGGGMGQYTGNAVLFIPAFFHGGSRDPDTVKGNVIAAGNYAVSKNSWPITTGERIAFKGRINMPHAAGGGASHWMCYFQLWIDGSNYVLYPDGSWHDATAETEAQKTIPFMQEGSHYGDAGFELAKEYDFEFISEAAPATGDIFVKLWGTSDIYTGPSGSLDPEGVEYDDVVVLIVDEDGERLEAKLTEAWTGLTGKERETVHVVIGPGPTTFMPNRVTWNGGTYFTDVVTDLIVVAANFDEVIVETWLRFLNAFLERRSETYTGLDAEMGTPLDITSRLYGATSISKDLRHNRDTIESVRLVFDGISSILSAAYAETVTTFTASSAGVASAFGSSPVSIVSNLAAYLATQNPIAILAAEYELGDVVIVLTVDAVTDGGLRDEDKFVVVDLATARPFVFQMSADEADVTWDVEDPDNPGVGLTLVADLASGSGVYPYNPTMFNIAQNLYMTAKGDLLAMDVNLMPVRVPVGSNGQVLTANSGVDAGVEFDDIPNQVPITQKGDLVAGDAGGSPIRFPIGTDNQHLIADSTASLGVRWVDFSGGSGTGFRYDFYHAIGLPPFIDVIYSALIPLAIPPFYGFYHAMGVTPYAGDVIYTDDDAGTHVVPTTTSIASLLSDGNIIFALLAEDALDATDVTPTDGEAVKTFVDSSSNGNDAVQGTVASQPLYRSGGSGWNGEPTLDFDGSNDWMQFANGVFPEGDLTVICAYKGAASGYIWWFGNYTGNDNLAGRSSDFIINGSITCSLSGYDTAGDVLVWTLDDSENDATHQSYISDHDAEHETVGDQTDISTPQMLGARPNATLPTISTPLNGEIGEIWAWSRILTGEEITAMKMYLKNKYAIS